MCPTTYREGQRLQPGYYETNRYSVPTHYAGRRPVLLAFAFRVEVLFMEVIAEMPGAWAVSRTCSIRCTTSRSWNSGLAPSIMPSPFGAGACSGRQHSSYQTLLEQLREEMAEDVGCGSSSASAFHQDIELGVLIRRCNRP